MVRIGVDEVGRGPLAGPFTFCIFATSCSDKKLLTLFPKEILRDSKKLSEKNRKEIFKKLLQMREKGKVLWSIAEKSAEEIDAFGLSRCTTLCIQEGLSDILHLTKKEKSEFSIFLDGGLRAHNSFIKQKTIIKGDEKIPVIACASIIAKVVRDSFMEKLGKELPCYGFEKHKGYGTAFHRDAIKKEGESSFHRKSFLKNNIKSIQN